MNVEQPIDIFCWSQWDTRNCLSLFLAKSENLFDMSLGVEECILPRSGLGRIELYCPILMFNNKHICYLLSLAVKVLFGTSSLPFIIYFSVDLVL